MKNEKCCNSRFNLRTGNCCGLENLRWFLTLLAIVVCVGACNTQVNKSPHEAPTLPKLEQASNHYSELQKISNLAQGDYSSLDAIYFPDQVNKLLIKAMNPDYISKDSLRAIASNLQHPANSSKQVRAELDFLLQVQVNSTQAEKDEALRMHDIVYFPVIGMRSDQHLFFEAYEIFGEAFDPGKYPETKNLLSNIMKEMRVMEFTAKNSILRPRPRQLEKRLKPLKKMSSSSFVSGHTLWAYMQAYIFASLIPEKERAFLDLAYKIGYSREILGVHYPSDEEQARQLAHKLLTRMWENDDFINQLTLAAEEWRD